VKYKQLYAVTVQEF